MKREEVAFRILEMCVEKEVLSVDEAVDFSISVADKFFEKLNNPKPKITNTTSYDFSKANYPEEKMEDFRKTCEKLVETNGGISIAGLCVDNSCDKCPGSKIYNNGKGCFVNGWRGWGVRETVIGCGQCVNSAKTWLIKYFLEELSE